MPSPRQSQQTITATVLVGAFLYAIIRYNILKGVAWDRLPLFISNKAISLSAVVFIVLSYVLGPLARFWPATIIPLLGTRKFFGLLGFGLAAVHGLMSFLLFTPANYPKFFSDDGTLNLIGELSILFGVFAFLIFAVVAVTALPGVAGSMNEDRWQAVQRMGYAGLLLVLLHVVVMGYAGWVAPSTWPSGLLPISLVAAIVIAIALLLRVVVFIFPGEYDVRLQKPASAKSFPHS